MATSSKSIRSISFPCRLHPNTSKIEEGLTKFRTWESEAKSMPNAETLYNGLCVVEDIYKCNEDLLNLPLIRQALSSHQHEEWINEVLDGSVKLLDICGSTRDIMSQVKDHARELQSALRRRKGDLCIDKFVSKYKLFIKKMKKDVNWLIYDLKKVEKKRDELQIYDLQQNVATIVRLVNEVDVSSISIIKTVLLFLYTSLLKPKEKKWSLVSRLMYKQQKIACEDQENNANEMNGMCGVLSLYCPNAGQQNMSFAQERLEVIEAGVVGIENGLERLFRCLIRTRASLLNIVYQ